MKSIEQHIKDIYIEGVEKGKKCWKPKERKVVWEGVRDAYNEILISNANIMCMNPDAFDILMKYKKVVCDKLIEIQEEIEVENDPVLSKLLDEILPKL